MHTGKHWREKWLRQSQQQQADLSPEGARKSPFERKVAQESCLWYITTVPIWNTKRKNERLFPEIMSQAMSLYDELKEKAQKATPSERLVKGYWPPDQHYLALSPLEEISSSPSRLERLTKDDVELLYVLRINLPAILSALKDQEHSYTQFFDEVCRKAEKFMLKSHKLEGMHFLAMKEVKAEWDAAQSQDAYKAPSKGKDHDHGCYAAGE